MSANEDNSLSLQHIQGIDRRLESHSPMTYRHKTARRFERKSGKLTLRRRLRDAYAMPTHSVHSRTLRKRLYQSRRLKVV